MPIRSMIDGSAIAAVVTNPLLPDNPIIACNRAFEELTGYPRAEALGRNCRFLARGRVEPQLSAKLEAAVRERRPLLTEIQNFKKDGTPFRNSLIIVPIFDSSGELIYFFGSQSEVRGAQKDTGEAAHSVPGVGLDVLTGRQIQVLGCIVTGKRNKAIARELGISERTVKMHRADILTRLGVATSAEAIKLAVEAHLVPAY